MGDETGLITPDNLPLDILDTLSHGQIHDLGIWLFEQLKHQKEFSLHKESPVEGEYCEHVTREEFIAMVVSGAVTDDDGVGKYATDKVVTDIVVSLRGVADGNVRGEWTHVCWYNK